MNSSQLEYNYISFEGFRYASESPFTDSEKNILDVLRSRSLFECVKMEIDYSEIDIVTMTGTVVGCYNRVTKRIQLNRHLVSYFDTSRHIYFHEKAHDLTSNRHDSRFAILVAVMLARHFFNNDAFEAMNVMNIYEFQDVIIYRRNRWFYLHTYEDSLLSFSPAEYSHLVDFKPLFIEADKLAKSRLSIEEIALKLLGEVELILDAF